MSNTDNTPQPGPRSTRTLIVAHLKEGPGHVEAIADIFAESDATDLPHMIGVTRRTLFQFHDLYFHLVEADPDFNKKLYAARSTPLYDDINKKLAEHVWPYDPNWKEPKDAMAQPFYVWTPDAA